jgi:hypothetical protein
MKLNVHQMRLRPVGLPVRVRVVVPAQKRECSHILSASKNEAHCKLAETGCWETSHRSCSTPLPGLAVLRVHTASRPISRLSLSSTSSALLPSNAISRDTFSPGILACCVLAVCLLSLPFISFLQSLQSHFAWRQLRSQFRSLYAKKAAHPTPPS